MQAGKSLVGKDGVFTPLMKEFLETALEGEMNSHMASSFAGFLAYASSMLWLR